MNTPTKLLIVLALAVVVVGAVVLKNHRASAGINSPSATPAASGVMADPASDTGPVAAARLPKLIDLGADKCIPCKAMAPILEELKKEHAHRFTTEFIDVWKNPNAGKAFGVEIIPTQIFIDADGKELFRHVGFYGKEDILGKWRELGVDVSGKSAAPTN